MEIIVLELKEDKLLTKALYREIMGLMDDSEECNDILEPHYMYTVFTMRSAVVLWNMIVEVTLTVDSAVRQK